MVVNEEKLASLIKLIDYLLANESPIEILSKISSYLHILEEKQKQLDAARTLQALNSPGQGAGVERPKDNHSSTS